MEQLSFIRDLIIHSIIIISIYIRIKAIYNLIIEKNYNGASLNFVILLIIIFIAYFIY